MARVNREVDELWADFIVMMPPERARQIGAAYARYSTANQDSAADQFRVIFEDAVQQGIHIPRELIFFDLATSGAKKNRPGLAALIGALQQKQAQALLLFSTSRLFRNAYETGNVINQLHQRFRVRCRFVSQQFDTDDARQWELMLNAHSFLDQMSRTMNVENIRASQKGLAAQRLVHGTLPFGYTGQEIEGTPTKRGHPRRRIVIEPQEADVIRQVYRWYVNDRLSMQSIAERLNALAATVPPARSGSGRWTLRMVSQMLGNEKYRGKFLYGVTETVFLADKDYRRGIPREEPLAQHHWEELRIVTDEMWLAAQELRRQRTRCSGAKGRGKKTYKQPKLISGLLWCPEHAKLWTYGQDAELYTCHACAALPPDQRALFTQLNRRHATRVVCEKIASLIREDESLVDRIVTLCQQLAGAEQSPDEAALARVKAQIQRLTATIEGAIRNLGVSEEDRAQTERVLQELRQERGMARIELERLERLRGRQLSVPTPEKIRMVIERLAAILMEAASQPAGPQFGAARTLIERVTGGRIELSQHGERHPRRGWVIGRSQNSIPQVILEDTLDSCLSDMAPQGEILFNFKALPKPPRWPQEVIDQAVKLFNDGLMVKQIAFELNLNRNSVSKLLMEWHDQRSLPRPNMVSRRRLLSSTRREQSEPPNREATNKSGRP